MAELGFALSTFTCFPDGLLDPVATAPGSDTSVRSVRSAIFIVDSLLLMSRPARRNETISPRRKHSWAVHTINVSRLRRLPYGHRPLKTSRADHKALPSAKK